jgi:hypothetical protein
MARKSTKPQPVEPEMTIHEAAAAPGPAPRGAARSKSDAVRQALAAGFEGPMEGTAYIRKEFGIEIAPQHFSSVKSQLKKRNDIAATKGKVQAKPKAASQAIEGYLAPPPKPHSSGSKPDLLDAIEAMKPLVASLGADKVKRIVDLLG